MGRAVLIIGAVVWGTGAIAAALIAAVGIERLVAVLPPLAIDAEAVRGAIVAVSGALALAAVAHGALAVGIHRRVAVARTSALLLCGMGVAVAIGLAATAFASAAAEPSIALPLLAGGVAALAIAVGYAAAVVWFVGEIRAGAPTGGRS